MTVFEQISFGDFNYPRQTVQFFKILSNLIGPVLKTPQDAPVFLTYYM